MQRVVPRAAIQGDRVCPCGIEPVIARAAVNLFDTEGVEIPDNSDGIGKGDAVGPGAAGDRVRRVGKNCVVAVAAVEGIGARAADQRIRPAPPVRTSSPRPPPG